jgi:hypothetical protein
MTTTYTRTAPSRRVLPAAHQPGPVTLAIRGVRPNSLPSWEMREQQIEDERRALRELRKRVANAVTLGIAFLDETGGDPDLEATGEDDEDTHDREAVNEDGGDIQDEPHDAEEDDDQDSGIGDGDGLAEQAGFSGHAYGAAV